MAKCIKKKYNPLICCLQENHFSPKLTRRVKVKGQKNIFQTNDTQNKQTATTTIKKR